MNDEQNKEIPKKDFNNFHSFYRRRDLEPADLKRMLREVLERQKSLPSFNPKEHKDKTRSTIALIFTYGYFGVIILGLVGVPIYNSIIACYSYDMQPLDLKDTILVIGSILGSTFGFVLGYYFKGAEHE